MCFPFPMLSPVYLASCTDDILKLYEELNDAVIRDIVRRLVALDFDVSQSAVWQMEKLQEIGFRTYEDTLSEIARRTGKTEKELEKLFREAGTETMRYDDSVYKKAGLSPLPLAQSPGMLQILTAGYRKCKGELKNLTLTTANNSQSLFINACNKAYMKISSGAFNYATAVMQAVEEIGKEGTWVLYPSGKRDRVDVAARRAVLTGVSQTCGELQIRRLDDMMWDVVDVTAHMGARPSHAVWQGGRFSYKGRNQNYPDFEETTGYGTVGGLMGANCRHNFYPAMDGSVRMYSQTQLDAWNNHKVSYNNTEYSDREALDMQRKYEREIRATKREIVALDEARKSTKDEVLKQELSEAFSARSLRLKQQNAALSDFLEQTELKREYDRTQVLGFDRSMSGKAKAAARKERTKVDNSAKSDIINDVKLHQGRQDKHIIGTNNYVPGKSYLTVSNDEIKQIIKDKSGTGTRVGNKEQITADKIIGVNVNQKHNYKTLTDKATIHYSNNGVHLVPTHSQLQTKSIPQLKKYCKKMAMQYYDTDSFTKYIGKLTAEEKEHRIDLLLESKQSKTSLIKDIKSMEKKILRERGEIK